MFFEPLSFLGSVHFTVFGGQNLHNVVEIEFVKTFKLREFY